VAIGALGVALSGDEAARLGLAWKSVPGVNILSAAYDLVARAAEDPLLARRVKHSATLELGPPAVGLGAAGEIERGVQMWSLARKGEAGWAQKPAKPPVG
jgi:enoyl-CoA hydratase